MSPKYTYLLVDMICFVGPFMFSFHPKINFYRLWRCFTPPFLSVALLFISWDMYFTYLGVWDFNADYVVGIYIGNLPLEEVLFFLCIPYACTFSYYCFHKFLSMRMRDKVLQSIFIGLGLVLLLIGVYYIEQLYTSVTFISTAIVLFYLSFIKPEWLTTFIWSYLFILVPFVLSNGILTGSFIHREVVHYSRQHILGYRVLTIPIEDTIYGMLLFILNVWGFEIRRKKLLGDFNKTAKS